MFKSIKKLILVVLILTAMFVAVDFVLAADVEIGLEYGESTGLSDTDPRTMVANIIKIALAFLGIIALILIIYGGFLWMTAAGNEERIETAKKVLISAIIGLIIILSAFGITAFLLNSITGALGPGGYGPGPGPGPITPPGPEIINCDLISITPECEIDNDKCKDGYFCNIDTCQCKKGGNIGDDCGILEPVCQPNNNDCASYLYCNDDCKCDKKSEIFEACNATSTVAVCEPDQSICSSNLTCDASDCYCKDFPVIKGVSPTGGFCNDEPNELCSRDSDCDLTNTSTCNIDTPNATDGNIITISGNYFGTTTGEVRFYDGSNTTILGTEPPDPCDANWSDDQIIIVVPPGTQTGPILIRTADNEEDTTDNDQGPMLPDLLINNIDRPGLCKIDSEEGRLGDVVSYYGLKFSPASGEARFGRYNGFLAGKNSVFLTTLEGSAGVPNISSGNVTSFVADAVGGQSNYLKFRKLQEIKAGPYIAFFEPESGASGQYVTIYGDGFGAKRNLSKVYFGDSVSGVEADYTFPDICADSVWSNNQIIIKVPEGNLLNDDNYEITIVLDELVEINTSQISPNTFEVDNNLFLSPSLCKISPTIGQPGDAMTLWGEYFDNFSSSDSKIRFNFNKDMLGVANISFWDIDPESTSGIEVYKVETSVHSDVSEGPVKVVKGNPENFGNGINFKVGSCSDAPSPDDACGADICCPSSTYKAGKCAPSVDDCYLKVPNSVYEWDFSTSPATTDIDNPTSSCIEKSRLFGTCEVDICPNSAGSCSFFVGGLLQERKVTGDCLFNCDIGACQGVGCYYEDDFDRCLDNTSAVCTLSATTTDIYGKDVTTYCDRYEGNPRIIMDIRENISCLSGWTKARGTSTSTEGQYICVDETSTCTPCHEDFICFDDENGDSNGVCALDKDICKEGSVCESDNKCRVQAEEDCECCCRIANAGADCCEPLDCAGNCGSDREIDTNNFGYCSGCRTDLNNDGSINANEQAISDEKCVCSGSSGKFCDVDVDIDNDGIPEGVCRDCAQLSNASTCSYHNTTCCVDAMDKDNCQGGEGAVDLADGLGEAYCGYYQCNDSNTVCEDNNLLAIADTATTAGKYFLQKDLESCTEECSLPSILGRTCAPKWSTSTCNTSVCFDPFGCLNSDGSDPVVPTACGTCCCDPLRNDQCISLAPNLICKADESPCSGTGRGLCCGCEDNSNCGNPEEVGCGMDACCRARPQVATTTPADLDYDSTKICPNAQIRVTFDQQMDVNSFSTNIVVVGEHDGVCPEGTVYLAKAGEGFEDKNVIVRTFYKVYNKTKDSIKKILGKETYASEPPVSTRNYCAVVGSVEGEQIGESGTTLTFSPTSLLDTDRKYYVIVKGDVDLDNGSGVLNFWDIGMNIGGESPVDNTASVFNGISYPRSYIWSFNTMEKQDLASSGICEIDYVEITPHSYLFQTTINDFNENDTNPNSKTFDTEKDKDKAFIAYPLSWDGQILVPVAGYSWIWNWSIDDPSVIEIFSNGGVPFGINDKSQLIAARDGIVDKKTYLNATVNLTDTLYSDVGNGETKAADIQVFLCENPWPPVDPGNGTWSPWIDNATNCLPNTGQCFNTNHLLYYCRDQGDFGVVDDLPSILSDAVIRGANDELLKESYFFREGSPEITGVSLSGVFLVRGQSVELSWNALPSPEETIEKYIVYFDTESGFPYAEKVEVDYEQAPHITGTPLIIEGLTNNTDYYFSVVAVYETGNSSDYSNEYMIMVADTEAPDVVMGISHTFKNATTTVEVSWLPNIDDTVKYRVYYSHLHDSPENYVEVVGRETDRANFNIQNRDGVYFVIVTALDEYENESDWSVEMPVVPTGF